MPKYRGFNTGEQNEFKVSSKPALKPPADTMIQLKNDDQIIEIFARMKESATEYMISQCPTHNPVPPLKPGSVIIESDGVIRPAADPEVRKIVDGGDQGNRIDVVFMGDGYTASEKEKFFSDMERLTQEMFEGKHLAVNKIKSYFHKCSCIYFCFLKDQLSVATFRFLIFGPSMLKARNPELVITDLKTLHFNSIVKGAS